MPNKSEYFVSLTGSDAQPKQEGGDISLSIEETKYVHCSYSFMFTYFHIKTCLLVKRNLSKPFYNKHCFYPLYFNSVIFILFTIALPLVN